MSTTPATDRPEAVIFDLDGTLVDTVQRLFSYTHLRAHETLMNLG
jgi:beta-phosphoglucomutase-like phosphatase (HAD superfamily)